MSRRRSKDAGRTQLAQLFELVGSVSGSTTNAFAVVYVKGRDKVKLS